MTETTIIFPKKYGFDTKYITHLVFEGNTIELREDSWFVKRSYNEKLDPHKYKPSYEWEEDLDFEKFIFENMMLPALYTIGLLLILAIIVFGFYEHKKRKK